MLPGTSSSSPGSRELIHIRNINKIQNIPVSGYIRAYVIYVRDIHPLNKLATHILHVMTELIARMNQNRDAKRAANCFDFTGDIIFRRNDVLRLRLLSRLKTTLTRQIKCVRNHTIELMMRNVMRFTNYKSNYCCNVRYQDCSTTANTWCLHGDKHVG